MISTTFAKLRSFLASWREEARAKKSLDTVMDVECVQELTNEAAAIVAQVHDMAHRAEVHDLEAAAVMEKALADGLDASDVPAVRRAMALLKRSAQDDHTITEVAHA